MLIVDTELKNALIGGGTTRFWNNFHFKSQKIGKPNSLVAIKLKGINRIAKVG
jgi:hypothetical protein